MYERPRKISTSCIKLRVVERTSHGIVEGVVGPATV